jgi:transcription termination factor Rho
MASDGTRNDGPPRGAILNPAIAAPATAAQEVAAAQEPGGGGGGGGGDRHHPDMLPDFEEVEVISQEDLERTKNAMNLAELKRRPAHELVALAESMGLDNLARSRKQDIIFSILKAHAKNGEDIYGDGVLEILQDGFGFLRFADGSYLAGPGRHLRRPARSAASACAPATCLGPDPAAEGRRALFRAAQGRRDQLRVARERARTRSCSRT